MSSGSYVFASNIEVNNPIDSVIISTNLSDFFFNHTDTSIDINTDCSKAVESGKSFCIDKHKENKICYKDILKRDLLAFKKILIVSLSYKIKNKIDIADNLLFDQFNFNSFYFDDFISNINFKVKYNRGDMCSSKKYHLFLLGRKDKDIYFLQDWGFFDLNILEEKYIEFLKNSKSSSIICLWPPYFFKNNLERDEVIQRNKDILNITNLNNYGYDFLSSAFSFAVSFFGDIKQHGNNIPEAPWSLDSATNSFKKTDYYSSMLLEI